jgi:hypothetical protein
VNRALLFAFATASAIFLDVDLASGATIAADYQLQDTFDSSVGTIGPLSVVGPPGNVTFVSDTVNGNPQQVLNIAVPLGVATDESGVQTQTATFLDPSNYSVVLLASFDINQFNPISTKLFDFKNLSTDAGLYINGTTGTLTFIDDSAVPQGTGGATAGGTYVQIVLTRDSTTNLTSVYEDGALVFSFTDNLGLAVMADSSVTGNAFLTLFKDDGGGLGGEDVGEATSGNIARLRLYDGVLTPEEIAGLDTAIPEPSTIALSIFGGAILGRRLLRRKR